MAEDDDGTDERMLLGVVESGNDVENDDDDVDNGQEREGE